FGRDDPEEFDIPVGREIDSSLDMWIHFDFHRQNSDPGFARLLPRVPDVSGQLLALVEPNEPHVQVQVDLQVITRSLAEKPLFLVKLSSLSSEEDIRGGVD